MNKPISICQGNLKLPKNRDALLDLIAVAREALDELPSESIEPPTPTQDSPIIGVDWDKNNSDDATTIRPKRKRKIKIANKDIPSSMETLATSWRKGKSN